MTSKKNEIYFDFELLLAGKSCMVGAVSRSVQVLPSMETVLENWGRYQAMRLPYGCPCQLHQASPSGSPIIFSNSKLFFFFFFNPNIL